MATCNFCGQEFENTQAVRAHLKWCPPYRGQEEPEDMPKEAIPKAGMPRHAQPKGDDPVTRARQEYEKEKVDFKLDRIREERGDWKERQEERERATQRREREAREARAEEELEQVLAIEQLHIVREEKSRQQDELRNKEKIRLERIQQAKIQAVDQYYYWPRVPSEFKVQAKREIEKELNTLQIEYLPDSELKEIAEAIRDRAYKPFFERLAREEQERQVERDRVQRRSALLNQAEENVRAWVKEELKKLEGYDPRDWILVDWQIAKEVREILETDLQGDEAASEVKDIAIEKAEEILDARLDEMGYE
ncbi:MAG: hypothetical protein L0Y56_22990 [Nitrospira sp.]|nr:hypothetical protein [Nitrospira sp.]